MGSVCRAHASRYVTFQLGAVPAAARKPFAILQYCDVLACITRLQLFDPLNVYDHRAVNANETLFIQPFRELANTLSHQIEFGSCMKLDMFCSGTNPIDFIQIKKDQPPIYLADQLIRSILGPWLL